MKPIYHNLLLLTTLILPAVCSAEQVISKAETMGLQLGVSPVYEGRLVSLAKLNIRDAKLEEVISGLQEPRAFEFLNDHELLITEIGGSLKHFDFQSRQLSTVSGLPKIATGHNQTGLFDIEIHPNFASNRRIYFSYSINDEQTGKYFTTAVSTAVLKDGQLYQLRQILVAKPFGWSPSNFGGVLEFDSDGYLYVSIGDRSEHEYSQLGKRLEGKLLRLNDDGSVPADNPFVDDEAIDDRIYAFGIRNAQGLHFDTQTGLLFEAEHGPLGGDEVNVMKAGANYGWPTITYGKNYTTASIGVGTHAQGFEQPLFYYLPSEAISPLVMYRGDMFPEWEGDLLVGALKGKHISKLDYDKGIIRSEYPILNEINARIRDIKVASDGSIYVLAQTGFLYRLYREPTRESEELSVEGERVYRMVCAGCHDFGAYDAPRLGVGNDWKTIIEQPAELTLQRTIDGYNNMPERGLCGICSDEHLETAIKYMLEQAD